MGKRGKKGAGAGGGMLTTGMDTLEFRHEFAAETDRMLRRRLVWFIAIWGGLGLLSLVGFVGLFIARQFTDESSAVAKMAQTFSKVGYTDAWFVLMSCAWVLGYGAVLALVLSKKRGLSRRAVVWLSIGLICLDGLMGVTGRVAGVPWYNLFIFWISFTVACAVFPWTVAQAVLPLAIMLGISGLGAVAIEGEGVLQTGVATALFVAACLPALGIVAFHNTQRLQKTTSKFFQTRYGMLRQELAYARQIHESMFPARRDDGLIRLDYTYEPMRQIGGDYLHAHAEPIPGGERLSVVVLDVTGHGIPAALTVNRLFGEIDINFAENPDITPGEMLRRLNTYVHLTLAKHSIYATALCLRIDTARGVVEWASGGHPPAFLRGADGTVKDLEPTTFVLGACPDGPFGTAQHAMAFGPGDSIVAYTDGAIEARRPGDAQMLRVDGMRAFVADAGRSYEQPIATGSWAQRVLEMVGRFRGGMPAEDDTLVVEIFRPLAVASGAGRAG